jgi:VIT1/CCC1 family predicted Fe2+/Mn2+ transporter
MNILRRLHRHLDPSESLGELIFGLIMVLTFTLGARLLEGEEPVDGNTLMIAAIGCNLAWGIIDGFLFVLSRVYERRRVATLAAFLHHADEMSALAAIERELENDLSAIVDDAERDRFYKLVARAARHRRHLAVHVLPEDIRGAVAIFCLVLVTAVPAALPFLLIGDGHLALRASNALLVALLFVIGFLWGRQVGAKPWLSGFLIMSVGAALALIAILLGG